MLLQWYLTHDVSGGVRERPYSSNLLDPSAPNVLVGFLQWLDSGMPGYDGRAKTDKPVGAGSCWLLRCSGVRQPPGQNTQPSCVTQQRAAA